MAAESWLDLVLAGRGTVRPRSVIVPQAFGQRLSPIWRRSTTFLVPEHQELGVLGRLMPGQHNQEAGQTTNEQVDDRNDHSASDPSREVRPGQDPVIDPTRSTWPSPLGWPLSTIAWLVFLAAVPSSDSYSVRLVAGVTFLKLQLLIPPDARQDRDRLPSDLRVYGYRQVVNAVREVRELDERPSPASPPLKTSPGIYT